MTLKSWSLTIVSIIIFAIVGLAIWRVWEYVPVLGAIILVAIGALVILAVVAAAVWLLKFFFAGENIEIGQYGTAIRWMGQVQQLAPVSPMGMKQALNKTTIVESDTIIPTLTDLITSGDIAPGVLEMVMGYDKISLNKGLLQLVKGPWPGTHAVAGKGRSGKTRRVIGEVCQALIGGALITICDPHATKPDSLANALAPLAPWLRIARGEQQIIEATREFLNEMEKRVAGTSTERNQPRLIVFDEWARLMTNSKIEDDDRELLITTATNCSTEYTGYNGFCCLISQTWTQDSCGGTDIRRSLQVAFCHNISAEFAAFFFRQKKWQNRAEELKRRECLYKDYEGVITEIMTIGIPDDCAVQVAEIMTGIAPPVEPAYLSRTPQRELEMSWQSNTRMAEIPMRLNGNAREMDRFAEAETEHFQPSESNLSSNVASETPVFSEREAKKAEIIRLRSLGFTRQGEIMQSIWKVRPGATQAYSVALAEYKSILEEIVRGA